jgi:sulfide dehydrogenase cytochrome subunit
MRLIHFPVLASVLVMSIATAAEPNVTGQRLAATCAACHGTSGTAAGGALPALAGQPKDALVSIMKAFSAGTRPATIMHQIAKGYSEEQIELLAAYFSAQKK